MSQNVGPGLERRSRINGWGVTAIISLAAAIPSAALLAALTGRTTPGPDVLGLILQVSAISFGLIAATRGSRWWLIVSAVAALWATLTVLLFTIGE